MTLPIATLPLAFYSLFIIVAAFAANAAAAHPLPSAAADIAIPFAPFAP